MPDSVRSRIISLSNSARWRESEEKAAGRILFVGVQDLAGGDEPDAVARECRQLLIQVEHRRPNLSIL